MKLNKMQEELLKTIEQLQYEISLLGLDREELTGVTTRTEELKEFAEKINKSNTEIDNDNSKDWFNSYEEVDNFLINELNILQLEFPVIDITKPELNTIEAIKVLTKEIVRLNKLKTK